MQRWITREKGGYIKVSEGPERNITGDGCKSEKPGDMRKINERNSIKWEGSMRWGGWGERGS